MPAHQTLSMIGEVRLSSGHKLSVVDWRANRLADALAKQEAALRELPTAACRILDSAACAVTHAAKLLGRVTHAANNFVISEYGPNGVSVNKTIRDATQAPRGHKRKAETVRLATVCSEPVVPSAVFEAKAWTPSTCPLQKRCKSAASLHLARLKQQQEASVIRRVSEIGASLGASSSSVSAASRLDELSRRVRRRIAP